jgi:AtzH-like
MLEVNIPEVVAELSAAFDAYERALTNNDIETLNALFWNSPHTLRYGVGEISYGHAEIAEFRRRRSAVDQRRTLRNRRISTFGRDFGVADTEYIPAGAPDKTGRQSQTWVRTDDGWKIVSAHVSFMAQA